MTLCPVGYLGDRDIPPGTTGVRARRGIGGDDNDRGVPLDAELGERCLELREARHLARFGAEACRMSREIDTRAAGEEVVERGAATTALQPVDAAEPAIVEHDDVELLAEHHRGRDLGVYHQIGAVADQCPDLAIGHRELGPERAAPGTARRANERDVV